MALLPDESGSSGDRPHPRGPRLRELAAQRQERCREPAEIESDQQAVYEAVRAGVPTYLRMLDSADRDVRGYSAHLLSCFPERRERIAPVLAARLAVEPDAVVGALLCLAAGLVGEPGGTPPRRSWWRAAWNRR